MIRNLSPQQAVEWLRLLSKDHAPDGWPAVKMSQLTAMGDLIERLARERDDTRVALEAECAELQKVDQAKRGA